MLRTQMLVGEGGVGVREGPVRSQPARPGPCAGGLRAEKTACRPPGFCLQRSSPRAPTSTTASPNHPKREGLVGEGGGPQGHTTGQPASYLVCFVGNPKNRYNLT